MRFWLLRDLRSRVKSEVTSALSWMRHFLSFSVVLRLLIFDFLAMGCLKFVSKAFPSHSWHSQMFGLLFSLSVALLSVILEVAYFQKSKIQIQRRLLGGSHFSQSLLVLIPERNREYILGDLEEEYRTGDKRFPRLWYLGQVIALMANYWWAALRRLAGLDVIRKMIRK